MRNSVNTYIGIDFSKEKFNACLMVERDVMAEDEFANNKGGYKSFVIWSKKCSGLGRAFSPSGVLVCGEHTGTCSAGLSDFLYEKGFIVWLENAMKIKHSSGLSRTKDDKADAAMIARYAYRFYEPGQTKLYKPDSDELKRLRSLYTYRHSVVRERVALGNQIKSGAFDSSDLVKRMMQSRHERLEAETKELEKEMRQLLENSEELSRNYAILDSFKGVGLITAAVLIIYTSNFTKFSTAREFACFCGVAPFGKQSGTSINVKPHVSRFAHIGVKAAIVQACKAAMRSNGAIKAYAERLEAKGKHEGIVMNNVKNKLIHILFKMIQSGTLWDKDYQANHEPATKADKTEKAKTVDKAEAPQRVAREHRHEVKISRPAEPVPAISTFST